MEKFKEFKIGFGEIMTCRVSVGRWEYCYVKTSLAMHVFFPLETANRSVLADTRVFNDFKWQVAFLNAKEWEKSMSLLPLFKQSEAEGKL